jgi:hypothetical protein
VFVVVYFVIDRVRKLLDTLVYLTQLGVTEAGENCMMNFIKSNIIEMSLCFFSFDFGPRWSCQLYATSTLPPGKEPLVPVREEAGWVPEPV